MRFCPNCANLLLIEEKVEGVRFYCKTCPYIYIVEEVMEEVKHLQRK